MVRVLRGLQEGEAIVARSAFLLKAQMLRHEM
jgi:hypothetical protein